MIRPICIALCASLAGCSLGIFPLAVPACVSDAQCAEGEVCFPEGCGDPGSGLVVEVQGNSRSGQLGQDFQISYDGGFSPTQDFELKAATSIVGEFQRNQSPTGDPILYTDPVTVQARGESDLIPGIVRTYRASFPHPERGIYSLPVGSGHYVVTAEPDDPSIPPTLKDVTVQPGVNPMVSFAFPSSDGTLPLSGRLLWRMDQIGIYQAAMDLQAFDPLTSRPLSQPTRVSSGTTGSDGTFVLWVAPEASKMDSILLVASPHDPASLVPSKSFTILRPYSPTLVLLMGDFGTPLPQLQGELVSTTDLPIAGASVYLAGPVTGGGTFKSKVVVTDAKGVFHVDLLPSAMDGSYVLTALPPPTSTSGVLVAQVQAIAVAGQIAILSRTKFVAPDKLVVIGSVVRPAGDVAIGVSVIAHAIAPLKELKSQPLPMGETEGITDELGHFSLTLDPGVYRIDFIPLGALPRTSRVVTVRVEATADGGTPMQTVDLKEFPLSKARTVSGAVTLPANDTVVPATSAQVRYFHVATVEGRPTSLLLGQAVTDDNGNYTLTLPTR